MPLARLVKLLVSLLVAAADWSVARLARLLGRRPRARCVVLYYHAISSAARQQFARQMDELLRLSTPVDVLAKELPSGRSCGVTFDDGFVSVVENALPEMRQRGIPCAIFIPTGPLGGRPTWIDPSHPDGAETVVSREAVKALARDPLVRIGSHSVSHPNFTRLDDDRARAEMVDSKATLEELLGADVTLFSFPHGAYTERSLELAKDCGYGRVFTIEPTRISDSLDRFVVGRVRVEPHDWPIEFRLKVLGAYRWLVPASAMRRKVRRALGAGRARSKGRLECPPSRSLQ